MTEQLTSPADMRRINRRMVLDAIWGESAVTAAEIVRRAGLTRATVYGVCDELIDTGWIVELERMRPPGEAHGRPARRFAFAHRAASIVAVDAGSYSVRAAIADLVGNVLGSAELTLAGDAQAPEERRERIRRAIEDALANAGVGKESVACAALGIPAPVDDKGAVPRNNPFWSTMHADLPMMLQEWLGTPTLIENDANLAAIAERSYGVASLSSHVVALLSGYRMGSGVIAGGHLVRGWRGKAGELRGLVQVKDVGDTVGVSYWLVEECRRALEREHVPSGLRQKDARDLTAADIIDASKAGDPVATAALARAARRLGRAVAAISSILDPQRVVVCGSAAEIAAEALPIVDAEVTRVVGIEDKPQVEVSKLGNQVILLGAVVLALEHVRQNAVTISLAR